ncbi:MAG TPA: GNAT family N-acetyltransferase [Burkholderiales bacterium]|nr:GNAT family N-acetyltransferase [Burkholderiales bacterium]
MRIRVATSGDAATLIDFNAAMARETENKELLPEVIGAGVRSLLGNPASGFYVVAEEDGRLVGSLMVTREWSDWRNGDFWWIQSVYVRPEARRRGVYRNLYRHVQELAASDPGVCGFRLYVDRENAAAQGTYGALGMKATRYLVFEELKPGIRFYR